MLKEFRKKIEDLLEPVADAIEKHSGLLAVFSLLLVLLSAIGIAAQKLFWYDEIVTLFTSRLSSVGEVWRFFADGLDTSGPAAALMARAGSHLPLAPEIAVRMPFIVAFLCMCAGIYIFLRRRYPAGYALAGLFFGLTLPSLFFFMTEARAYAMMLAGVSLGMVFWQSAAVGKARVLVIPALFLALAFAIASHFFAIFLFVPFAVAQIYLDRTRKRIDWAVWLALVLFPVGFLPFLQGTERASNFYRAGFHAKASLMAMRVPYREIYNSGGWIVVSLLCLVAVWLLVSESKGGASLEKQNSAKTGLDKTGLSQAEWILAGVLALYPVYVVVASMAIGIFRQQYAVCFYVGFIVISVAGFAEVARRRAAAGVLALVAVLAVFAVIHTGKMVGGLKALVHPSRVHADAVATVMAHTWVQGVVAQELPVTVDPNTYMEFAVYGSPEIQKRMFEVIDEAEFSDPKYRFAVSDEQNFKYFSRKLPLKVMEIQDFLAANPHFLVVTQFEKHEWLPDYLMRHEAQGELSVKILSYAEDGYLLDVEKR